MSGNFNISNSKIDQFNSEGDNYKVSSNTAPVNISGGDGVQAAGEKNQVMPPEEPSFLSRLVGWLKGKLFGSGTGE